MTKYALEIEQLNKTYRNGVKALKDINLNVEDGDLFAFLGPNGAGKSTVIGIITTLFTAYFLARHLTSLVVLNTKNKEINI